MRVACIFLLTFLATMPRVALAAPSPVVIECIDHSERGQAARDGGRLLEARAELEACALARCPGAIRDACGTWGAALLPRIPSLAVDVVDESGQPVREARVWLDGARVAAASSLDVNPGTHALRILVDGHDPVEQRVVAREGEHDRKVTVVLPARIVAQPVPPPPSPVVRTVSHGPPVGSWIAGGLGAAAIVAGAVLEISALSSRADLDGCSPTCDPDRVDGIRRRMLVGDLAIGAGLVALVTGAALWFFAPVRASATARRPVVGLAF